jgi:hypothetical protein
MLQLYTPRAHFASESRAHLSTIPHVDKRVRVAYIEAMKTESKAAKKSRLMWIDETSRCIKEPTRAGRAKIRGWLRRRKIPADYLLRFGQIKAMPGPRK